MSLALSSRIQNHALKLLAAREHTRAELHTKLLRWQQRRQAAQAQHKADQLANYQPQQAPADDDSHAPTHLSQLIDQVLDKLEATGLLNDQRAAEAIVRSKSARFGAARMRHELKNKGVEAELTSQLLDDLQHNEAARAQHVWQKKYGTLPQTPNEYARQMRFLAHRGFSAELIHKILRGKIE